MRLTKPIISVERLRELLDYDPETGVFTWRGKTNRRIRVGAIAGNVNSRGYISIGVDDRNYTAHRLAWLWMYGEWPKNEIDHVNGIRTDNRLNNIRDVVHSVNMQNAQAPRPRKTFGHMGTTYIKASNKWQAQIKVNDNYFYLGLFDSSEQAHKAYIKAKLEMRN